MNNNGTKTLTGRPRLWFIPIHYPGNRLWHKHEPRHCPTYKSLFLILRIQTISPFVRCCGRVEVEKPFLFLIRPGDKVIENGLASFVTAIRFGFRLFDVAITGVLIRQIEQP
jgi:hypothetical protein